MHRHLRMPRGLCCVPATFQRLMNHFCNDLVDILVLLYLEDIIIFSEPFEKYILDLQAVFERLLLFKLKVERNAIFASSHVKFLGFKITQKGIEVDPEKVVYILDIPPSKNVKDVLISKIHTILLQ